MPVTLKETHENARSILALNISGLKVTETDRLASAFFVANFSSMYHCCMAAVNMRGCVIFKYICLSCALDIKSVSQSMCIGYQISFPIHDSSSSLSSDSAAQTLSFENSPKYQEFVSKIDNLYETQRQMRRKINTQAQLIRTQEKRLAVYQAQSLKWNEFMDKCGILEDKKEANV
eukprot:289811_1